MSGYRARIADAELVSRLEYTGAVVIEGPKACGKTSTGRAHTASEVLLDTDATARALMDVNPALILPLPCTTIAAPQTILGVSVARCRSAPRNPGAAGSRPAIFRAPV